MKKYNNKKILKRQNESATEKEARLEKRRRKIKENLETESMEKRQQRLAKTRENNNIRKIRKEKESIEQREARLAKDRERKRASRQKARSERTMYLKENLRLNHEERTNLLHSQSTNTTETQLVRKFHDSISEGPLYICTCCDQLWYKHSVSPADRLRSANPDVIKYLQNIKSVKDIECVCQTCKNHLMRGNIPPCAIANGMRFAEKPNFFDLNELECRLVAPRLAFEKIFQAPRGGQLKITGNVVNVPADVGNTVNMLPRLSNKSGTIKVQLKRKLQ